MAARLTTYCADSSAKPKPHLPRYMRVHSVQCDPEQEQLARVAAARLATARAEEELAAAKAATSRGAGTTTTTSTTTTSRGGSSARAKPVDIS